MTEEQIALARRAVACRGWRFMGGMRVLDPIGPHPQRISDDDEGEASWRDDYWLPDLTDPATLGCLLALVREAWDQGSITPQVVSNKKWLLIYKGFGTPSRFFYGTTEVKVLVVALEAAP